ncbi:hypothetical protein J1786_04150, partial [Rahnella sp. L72c]
MKIRTLFLLGWFMPGRFCWQATSFPAHTSASRAAINTPFAGEGARKTTRDLAWDKQENLFHFFAAGKKLERLPTLRRGGLG